jgi:hypothetical protein
MTPGLTLTDWWIRSSLGGGILLLLVWTWMKRGRQPAWRQRFGEFGLLAALLVNVLALMPPWLTVPLVHAGHNVANGVESKNTLTLDARVDDESADQLQVVPVPDDDTFALFALPPLWRIDDALLTNSQPDLPVAADQTEPSVTDGPGSWVRSLLGIARSDDLVDWLRLGALASLSIGACLLTRWLIGRLGLARLLRAAGPPPAAVARVFKEMSNRSGVSARLLVSRRLRTPISCGLLRPTIVIPRRLCRRSAIPALKWVFAHELTHVKRRDAWACLLFACTQVFYFYLPWFWWLRRQIRLSQEYIADAAAAQEAGGAADYAQFLLSLSKSSHVPLGATGVLGNSSDLFRRVSMLLQSPVRAGGRSPLLWSLASAAVVLGLSVVVSGVGFRAAAAGEPTPITITARVADDDSGDSDMPKVVKVIGRLANDDEEKSSGAEERARRLREKVKMLRDELRQIEQQLPTEERPRELLNRIQVFNEQPMQKALNAYTFALQHTGGRLGIGIEKPGPHLADQLDLPKGEGVVIQEVVPNSAAAKAGLKAHDILLELDGKPVSNEPEKLVQTINKIKAKEPFDAVVLRKGRRETIKGISLPEHKAPEQTGLWKQFDGGDLKFWSDGNVKPLMELQRAKPFTVEGAGPLVLHSGSGGRGVMTTIFRNDDRLTARHQEGSLIITVTGTVADQKTTIDKITVQDGGSTHTYKSVEDVPEQYRDKVKNLVDMDAKGKVKIEVRTKERKSSKKKGGDDKNEDDDEEK